MLKSFLSSLEHEAPGLFERHELCRSIGQLPVPLLLFGDTSYWAQSSIDSMMYHM